MKKIVALLLCLLLAVSLVACGDGKSSSPASKPSGEKTEAPTPTEAPKGKPGVFAPSAENVRAIGRTVIIGDILWGSFSGTGVEFNFKGKTCSVVFRGDKNADGGNHSPKYGIYVDGKLLKSDVMKIAIETVEILNATAVEEHVIKIVKLSESSDSTMGIVEIDTDDEASVTPTANAEKLIEFVGDSITCGYGADGKFGDVYMTANENCTKAYAIKTAEKLGWDYSLVSFSGYGIVSGYTSSEKKSNQALPQYYEKFGNSYSTFFLGNKTNEIEWDFSRLPDVVVVNLGTNDYSYVKAGGEAKEARQEEYVVAYVDFLKQIRTKNPDAKIVCALGLMGQELYPQIEEAVKRFTDETGDTKVYSVKLDVQDVTKNDKTVDWHPTEASHEHGAEQMVEFIKSIM